MGSPKTDEDKHFSNDARDKVTAFGDEFQRLIDEISLLSTEAVVEAAETLRRCFYAMPAAFMDDDESSKQRLRESNDEILSARSAFLSLVRNEFGIS